MDTEWCIDKYVYPYPAVFAGMADRVYELSARSWWKDMLLGACCRWAHVVTICADGHIEGYWCCSRLCAPHCRAEVLMFSWPLPRQHVLLIKVDCRGGHSDRVFDGVRNVTVICPSVENTGRVWGLKVIMCTWYITCRHLIMHVLCSGQHHQPKPFYCLASTFQTQAVFTHWHCVVMLCKWVCP